MSSNEINQTVSMRLVLELEIKSIIHFTDVHTLFSCIMLQNELFKEQERPLVIDTLSDLHLCDPQMRSVCLLAVIALLVSNNEFNHEVLLK